MGVTQQFPLPPHNTNTEHAAAVVLLCEGPQAALHCSRGPLLGLPAQDHRTVLRNTAVMQKHALGGIQQARGRHGKHQLQDPTCTQQWGTEARRAHGCAHQHPPHTSRAAGPGDLHTAHTDEQPPVGVQYGRVDQAAALRSPVADAPQPAAPRDCSTIKPSDDLKPSQHGNQTNQQPWKTQNPSHMVQHRRHHGQSLEMPTTNIARMCRSR